MTAAEAKARILRLIITCQRAIMIGVPMKAALDKLESELSGLVDEIYDPPGADGVVLREITQPQENTEAVPYFMDSGVTRFHDHLNECAQCRNEPFNLCEKGASLLQNTADTVPNRF